MAAPPPPALRPLLILALLALHVLFLMLPPPVRTIRWLALSHATEEWRRTNGSAAHQALCARARRSLGLTRRQTRLCRASLDAFPHVAAGAGAALSTCRSLLADRRWDCAAAGRAPRLTPDLTTGTREQAFVYALASAAVVHAAARACAQGALWGCACSEAPRTPPDGLFKWGGCGDNVRWAQRLARAFTDGAERRRDSHFAGGASGRRRGSARGWRGGGRGGRGGGGVSAAVERQRRRLAALMTAVNQHNNRAGRKAVEASLQRQCKCHGVSGACSVRTCWRALPPALAAGTGARLLRAFAAAAGAVRGRRVGGTGPLHLTPARGEQDLAYIAPSPDYCEADRRTGSVGTHGRLCNATSRGYDSCAELCCGRGFRTERQERVERCHCKYYWCCYVRCKTCVREVSLHTCH